MFSTSISNLVRISSVFIFIPCLAQANLNCEFSITDAWSGAATAQIKVSNTGTSSQKLSRFTAEFEELNVTQSWAASVEGDNPYTFTPQHWNDTIAAGESISFGIMVSGNVSKPKAVLGGDCTSSSNLPPVVAIEECSTAPGTYLYANEFIVSAANSYVGCTIKVEDPEGMPVTGSFDWGDGTVSTDVDSSRISHRYIEGGEYETSLSVSDGELSSTATYPLGFIPGAGSAGTVLSHCSISGSTVSCEDRGSFDPDGDRLGFATFVDGEVYTTSTEPSTQLMQMDENKTYAITQGITDYTHVVEQKVYAWLEDGLYPVSHKGLECEFTVGEQQGYGTEATLSISNNTEQQLHHWQAQILFSGGTQIVYHDTPVQLIIVDGPEYYLKGDHACNSVSCAGPMPGESTSVKLILQGDISKPTLGGDCASSSNRPPVASFGECPVPAAGAYLYAGEFITAAKYTACELEGSDPDGDPMVYSLDWGDGFTSQAAPLEGTAIETHQFMDTGDYTLTLRVSDGELIGQASKIINGIGTGLPPQPLSLCSMDRDNLSVSCEDRGSFDPDGPESLGFAGFADEQVIKTGVEAFSFSARFDNAGNHAVRYGISDGTHVVEQRIEAVMGELEGPAGHDMDCSFILGESHDYGTEAKLVMRNTTEEAITNWFTSLKFDTGTHIVFQDKATQVLGYQQQVLQEREKYPIAAGESHTVSMILQGEISQARLGGDCKTSDNEPPVAAITNCSLLESAMLYANTFGVTSKAYGCSFTAEDPEGLPVSKEIDWGDGTVGSHWVHQYVKDGTYDITLSVSDGELASTANYTLEAMGASLAGTTLVHCAADRDTLTVSCEDRGSFDPDSALKYAAFVNEEVKMTGEEPLSFSHLFESEGRYSVFYGATDHTHIDQQDIYVDMEDIARPAVQLDLGCEFTLGESHDYGTEASVTITNTTGDLLSAWYAQLAFPGNSQIVRHSGARLHIDGSPSYTLQSTAALGAREAKTVSLIIQGDTEAPTFGGDCKVSQPVNRQPKACILEPVAVPGKNATYSFDASCSSDPDGDALSYTWLFGDGSASFTEQVTHVFAPGEHTVELRVSDGKLQDSTSIVVYGAEQTLQCEYELSSQWDTGFTAQITVTNLSNEAVFNWEIPWNFQYVASVTSLWGAELELSSRANVARALPWNYQIPAGGSVSFGMQGEGNGSGDVTFFGLCQ